jgi:hypothetical protein
MEKIFADGMTFKLPHTNAPEFIVGSLYVHLKKFNEFAEKHVNARGYVNMQIKESKKGSHYVELDQWERPAQLEEAHTQAEESEIPF